ncbi:putative glycosyltransferase [Desulfosporosinus acidiphilus SJ4]|uniref:Putative glycosyltransferase n=1 Tax=Desulfosporosinus acidiphilus (strain DSM 22704 / JCM 16185 / SJ4) TaxID=646529 RepID=I4DBF9_DESAJ|nr:glycosyltransferase family 2 protein [Desulfosporosinus acidiphilus]AFM43133.1 putative glycosyltransferase [Desulfosporosinus acidiphilus SJ4]
MEIALVVLNYNDLDTTRNFINSVKDYDSFFKIIVVDNCSTDNSFSVLMQSKSQKIDIIKTERNGGYAYGNNFGIKYALRNFGISYFIIANPDVHFDNKIINEMIKVYNEIEKVGIVAPRMISEQNGTLESWKLPTFFDTIKSLFFLNRFFQRENKKARKTSKYILVEVLPGSFFMISTEAIKNINYFDERTFLYMEENVLGYRLKQHGYKNVLIPDITYYHSHSVSINRNLNLIKKYKTLINSTRIYNNYYLKINFLQKLLFHLFAELSIIEKHIFLKVLEIKNDLYR